MTGPRNSVARARDFKLVQALGDSAIGHEARAQLQDHGDVKLWLRMLACSTQIEREIRTRLRQHFGTSLPRFDYLAQVERHPEGLRMNVLSRYLMVTGGNVTGLTDQLVADGLVTRLADPEDRRSSIVSLTVQGRKHFLTMAAEHEQWLVGLLGGFDRAHKDSLYELLGRLRVHLAHQNNSLEAAEAARTDRAATAPVAAPATPPAPAPRRTRRLNKDAT